MGRVFGLMVAAAGVAAGFVVVIHAGYWWNGGSEPREIAQAFPAAAVVLGVAALWLAIRLTHATGDAVVGQRVSRQFRRQANDWKRERAARIAELDANPDLRTYADRMRNGENWSDAQIAYDCDPEATATCAHLAPVELAMRRAGIAMKLQTAGIVNADCTVDAAALRLDPPARYGLQPQYDRSAEDPPSAAFKCDAHPATIFVVEASQAKPGTPRFPS